MQSDISITDVALKVGFYSQSHFTKYFKKVVGVTPKEFSR
ncbi:MAG: AraC family transcriptional regulator [Cyanobacteria bacterium J06628_3]